MVESQLDQDYGDVSEDQRAPQFFYYRHSAHWMMKYMGYDLAQKRGLNFDRGQEIFYILLYPMKSSILLPQT